MRLCDPSSSPSLTSGRKKALRLRSIIRNKTQSYLSQCADAALKSPICFTLGAVLVKGGKVSSSGYNHHRPRYNGAEVRTHGHRKPVAMYAEMHAVFSLTGMSPSFRKQQGAPARASPQLQTPCPSQEPLLLPPPTQRQLFKGEAPFAAREGHPRPLSCAWAIPASCCQAQVGGGGTRWWRE